MIEMDLDVGDLLNTSMLQRTKMLEMAKILHTMKETIAFTEENLDLSIDSRGVNLSKTDERKKKNLFRKDLAEKKKSFD